MGTAAHLGARPPGLTDKVWWTWPAVAVFGVGLLVTWALWQMAREEDERLVQAKTDALVQERSSAIQNRMVAYEQILRGGVSLFATLPTVSRDQWRDYVAHLEVHDNYPGFQGIGFARYVQPAEKERFIQQQRAQGLAQYDIRPPGDRAEYGPVTYLEPRSERNLRAHGFDMMSEPLRRAAMELARDSGQPAITGKLKLASEAAQSVNYGFLLYIPVYKTGTTPDTQEARRAALLGFVNSPFRMVDLLKGTLGANAERLTLNIYDGAAAAPEHLMYSDATARAEAPAQAAGGLFRRTTLNLHGRTWLLEFELPPPSTSLGLAAEHLLPLSGLVISLLLAALTHVAMARLRLVRHSERHYFKLANFDALTTLSNRAMFQDRLQECLELTRHSGQQFALLFIDLDHFKDVNDTLGHHWGDRLLQEVAQRLRSCMRRDDTVARLGGDEFTVILYDIKGPQDAAKVAQHLLDMLAKPYELENEPYFVSASIGVTLFPQDAVTAADLLKNADQAMYAAKRLGRNRHQFYSPLMQEGGSQPRLRLVSDLRGALKNGEFFLVYQPIVDLASREICKAEALIRWNSPKHGLVGPAEFIPLAEDVGLIGDIGNWVFQQASRQVAIWRQTLRADLQISVNVSPAQLKNPQGGSEVWLDTLRDHGLYGQAIGLEITESLLLDINPTVTQQLLRLRDAGVPVALDDFGTGYSSLSYLRKLDIDCLKIDRSFVATLRPDSDELALCAAIIVMAHKLGLAVVAEGVETPEQCELLVAAGCDQGQGYLFSRPVSPEDFERLVHAHGAPRQAA